MKNIRKNGVLFVVLLALAAIIAVYHPVEAASKKKVMNGYSKYLTKNKKKKEFKYFGIVDINQDGTPELMGFESKNQNESHWISLVRYKKWGVAPLYSVPANGPIIYNKYKKGIFFTNDYEGKIYEMLDDGNSNVKSLSVKREKGKITYHYYSGDLGGEYGTSKKITKQQYDDYLKSDWAFTADSNGSKEVTLYKNSAANRKKLSKGKIKY